MSAGWVISFPKSGRTWLRVMLDQLGIGCRYDHAGSDHKQARPAADMAAALPEGDGPVIFLHRDPRDTAVSGFHQVTARLNRAYPGGIDGFLHDPNHGLDKIIRFNLAWRRAAQGQARILTLSYEALQADTGAALARACTHLGATPDPAALARAVAETRFEPMRTREAAGGFDGRYGRILRPADPDNPSSFKLRRGKVGGFADELSAETRAWCAARLAETGYLQAMYPGGVPT
jgi:hypothetical protein